MAEIAAHRLLGCNCVVDSRTRVCPSGARVRVRVYGGILMSAEYEARIFELEMNLANAQLERDAAYATLELDAQTRERHALQMIADIADSAVLGNAVPTLETVRIVFGEWAGRQVWNKSQAGAILSAIDALDDIIAGRIKPGQKTAAQVVEGLANDVPA